MKQRLIFLTLLMGLAVTAQAETVTVKGVGIKFEPLVVFADPGDTIAFRQMATHFVESIRLPEGAARMISAMGADYDYKVEKPGLYLYKCPPHWGLRMGGLIVVGDEYHDQAKLLEALEAYREAVDDETARSLLKKIAKQIGAGKLQLPD